MNKIFGIDIVKGEGYPKVTFWRGYPDRITQRTYEVKSEGIYKRLHKAIPYNVNATYHVRPHRFSVHILLDEEGRS